MLSQLEAIKGNLKKTETKEVKSDVANILNELKESKAKAEGTNMEKWYTNLKDELIPAVFVPLSLEQARALVNSYQYKHLKKGEPLTQDDHLHLSQLAALLEEVGSQTFPNMLKEGFFVRLNTRSPKDARIFSPEMFTAIQNDCKKVEDSGEVLDDNRKLNIIYVNFVKKMIVHSGQEAVQLLADSHRIWQDITSAIDAIVDKFEMYVVIREWAHIHPSMEFRGFVYQGQLNAISSYNRAVCWPGIPERKAEIETKCRAYFEAIKHKIPPSMPNSVVDFAFLEGDERVTIVEFNDFADFEGCGANAELFDWVKDEGILTGKAPFETRLVMAPLPPDQLRKTLTKPFKIHLGWENLESWVAGVDYY